MGTAREMEARLKEPAHPIPDLPGFYLEQPLQEAHTEGQSTTEETSTLSPRSNACQQTTFYRWSQ